MSESTSLSDTLKDIAIKTIPILLAWGISAEVRLQTASAKLDVAVEQTKQTAAKLERDHDIIVQNASAIGAADKAMNSLEVQVRELIKLLNR
tara:strand:+ start:601 stop:876 length:276 start_codon:yes stop_codon:yes gene_type:complete